MASPGTDGMTADRGAVGTLLTDLGSMTKPSITGLNLVVTLGAYALADGAWNVGQLLALCGGTLLIVASAGVMNMVLEREGDRLMARTASRPLARGSMGVPVALAFAVAMAFVALPMLAAVNSLVLGLGLFAWFAYVFLYTPLKRVHPVALLVGAVPGAVPPLMGWAAATGTIELPGVLLFAMLVAWQMAHFLAIAIYRKDDYARAGIKTVAAVRGDRVAVIEAVLWTAALLVSSLALVATPVAGWFYGVCAAGLGGGYLLRSLGGFHPDAGVAWARRFFLGSVIYLPLLLMALTLDAALF